MHAGLRDSWITLAALLLLVLAGAPASAEKTDHAKLENGDDVNGEIKELQMGQLRYSTDYMDTIFIEWDHVLRLTSPNKHQVEMQDGKRYFGRLAEPSQDGKLLIVTMLGPQELDIPHVVTITPIKQGFLEKIDGSVGLGFSFTRASDVAQLTFHADASYRTRKHKASIALNSIVTDDSKGTSRNQNAGFSYSWLLKNRRFVISAGDLQQNTELGIQLRALASGRYGRHFIQTNRSLLDLAAGLSVNREFPFEGEVTNNAEIILTALFRNFRYDTPKTDLDMELNVFPNVTTLGRWRVQFDTKLRRELVKDFFWDLSLYYTFDSDPPSDAVSNDDYGIVTSFGWTF